jgi:energy-coupling factor transporter ATP-binding protein EcfA2
MAYEYSELDKKNLGWFVNDFTRTSLVSIRVRGRLRSLKDLQIDMSYPITAIAGRNGSGKTTILALAACAYSNSSNGYVPPGRRISYYRHSDFFVRTEEDSRLSVDIGYQFLYDKWVSKNPEERGAKAGWKYHYIWSGGGRWSYKKRLRRTVVYLGIDRIVPDAEKSVSKGYRWHFRAKNEQGWEEGVKVIVGRILGTEYKSFSYKEHSKYRLPVVSTDSKTYSGFNMGAGEEALFGLFAVIKELPDGSLVLIDEIELGLHEEAQVRLIQELKTLCGERKLQVICTTHSPRILDSLPPEGRIFLERVAENVTVIPGISSAFATGKLSGLPSVELDVLVEDEVAKLIIETGINSELRSRIRILPVGSSIAVMRHLAARYKEEGHLEVCAILDGDKSTSKSDHIKAFLNAVENPKDKADAQAWVEKRLNFLPGETHPEAWVVKNRENAQYSDFQNIFKLSQEQVVELLQSCRLAGKHNEFFQASKKLNLDLQVVAYHLIHSAFMSEPIELERINKFISSFLN